MRHLSPPSSARPSSTLRLRPEGSLPKSVLRPRLGLSYIPVIAYLLGFVVLLLLMDHYFLTPAYQAAQHAGPDGLRRLKAVAWLMLTITLVYLLCGLMLTFRIGRFFFPRPTSPRVRTMYIDIWAEAGKRMNEKKTED
jgi:hypothetical protein